jgi:hypothetical protein
MIGMRLTWPVRVGMGVGAAYFLWVLSSAAWQRLHGTSVDLTAFGQFGDSMAPITTLLAAYAAVMTWQSFSAERSKDARERFDSAFFRLMDLHQAAYERYEDEAKRARSVPDKGSAAESELRELLDCFARGDAGVDDSDAYAVVQAWMVGNENRPKRYARAVMLLLEWFEIELREIEGEVSHHLDMFWGSRSRVELDALRRIVHAIGSDRSVRAATRLGLL